MNNKTLMVAAREYGENVRTKTFWIGILAFPVILIAMAIIPRLLEQAKDVRRYAVIDNSDIGLLAAMEERAAYADLERLLRYVRREARKGESTLNALPGFLRQLAASVKDLDDEALTNQAKWMSASGASMMQSDGDTEVPDEMKEQFSTQWTEYLLWSASLSPEDARELGAGIKREDYERVELPEGVDDLESHLREQVDDGELFAYFVIGPYPVAGNEGNKYISNNRTDQNLRDWLESLASAEVELRRFELEQIDPSVARSIQEPIVFEEKQVSASGEEKEVSSQDHVRQWAPVVFVYMLWISVFTIAQMLLTNTVEEKSNRIIEVLLSSVSPLQLMIGKILGIAATGLTTIGFWVICFVGFLKFLPGLMDLPGDLDLSVLVSDPVFLTSFVAYFLLGYLLYASILVGLGAACNSLKEAQNLMSPIMILLILPLAAMVPVGKDPNGTLAVVLSFIPPFTPFVMMNRAAGPPAAWEYVVTTILLVVSIAITFKAAAKIFRVGILMTGKPPKPTEIWRWIWTKDAIAVKEVD